MQKSGKFQQRKSVIQGKVLCTMSGKDQKRDSDRLVLKKKYEEYNESGGSRFWGHHT
jgi:hypothetical protein